MSTTFAWMLRRFYVAVMRGVRGLARAVGFLGFLERRRERPWACYLRSLFSIYDAADLAELDLPWWTFPAARKVEEFLSEHPGARAFEYGSGASTIWLSRRCGSVVSVEHDRRFAIEFAPLVSKLPNVTLMTVEPQPTTSTPVVSSQRHGYAGMDFADYVASIDRADGPFDIVVIDGRARVACLWRALRHLAPRGMIVFDNANRREYRDALRAACIRSRELKGMVPALPYPGSTAIVTTV